MLGTGDLELDLNSLNDSLASGMSTTMQDLYSYGNLNSASSLSWADDEVENYATMKVQHYLDNLEEYLLTGHLPTERCFQQVEAEQWRTQLVLQFNLQQLLKDSRRQISEDKLRMNPKKELEIQGHSFAHLPSSKYGSTSGYSQFQTPRVRSAYPMKKQTQPIRIRSAYPLKSPPVTNSGLRAGVRSGYSANRSRSPLKHTDYMKMLDDTARLSIQRDATVVGGDAVPFNNKTTLMTATKTVNSQLRRIRLPPSGLPKFTDNIPESAMLPPLIEARNSLRSRAKPKTNPVNSMANFKSASSNFKSSLNSSDSGYLISGRKPTSAAAQHRGMPSLSKPGQHQPYRQTYNNIPASQTTYRTGNNRNDMEVSIELVGTSLSLFEPVVRPVRVPKLRTNF